MSSIPLPALGVHVPQQEDPVQNYVKLKSLLQGQQLQQQQIQENNLGIQQKQQSIKDQQAMTSAMQEWDGKDLESLPSLVMKKGGSAQAVFGIKQKALEQKQAYSKIAADDATTGAKNLESMKVKNDMVLGEINSALQAPDAELAQRVTMAAQDLAQKQLLDPQHVQLAQQIVQSGDPQKIRAALGIFAKGYMSQSQQMAQAKEEADLEAKKAQLPGIQAESQMKSEEAALPPVARALKNQNALEYYAAKGDPDAQAALQKKIQVAQASRPPKATAAPLSNSTLSGEEFLKTLPLSLQSQVKAIAEGRSTSPPANSRSETAQQIRAALFQYDPSFSEQRAQLRKAFLGSGPEAKNIGNVNTAIVHLGRLGDTAEAMKNGSFTPGNEMYNYFKDKFGSQVTTNFGLLKDAVAGEMAAALKGTATDIEIEKMGKSIRASNSPEQMGGVLREGMGILSDKATTYEERYHAQSTPDDTWSPILPRAKATLQKYGVSTAGAKGGASPPPERPVYVNGKLVGYTSDGKSMRAAQ